MSGALRVFRAELARLVGVRSNAFVLLLLAGVAALRAGASAGFAAAEADDAISSGTAWAPFVDGWRAGLVLGALMLVALGARSLAGDAEHGLLRLAFTRSVSRGALVLGRLLLAPVLVLGLVAATGLAAWATANALGDFGDLVEDGYTLLSADELADEVRRGLLAVLSALAAAYAFGLCVGSTTRSATLAVSASLGLFLAYDLFKELLGDAQAFVFASHVPTLADGSAWSELPGVMRGFSDAGIQEGLFRAGWIVPLPTLVLFGLLSWFALQRRAQ